MANEFESYRWAEGKDAPRKECDDAADAIRYLHAALGEPTGAFTSESIRGAIVGRPELAADRLRFDPPLRLCDL